MAEARRLDNSKLEQLQADVDDTVVIMRDNIEMTIDRGEKLEDLEERSERIKSHFEETPVRETSEMLVEESKEFQQTTKKIKKKYWWKNKKWQMVMIAVAVAVVLIIILAIVLSIKPWQS